MSFFALMFLKIEACASIIHLPQRDITICTLYMPPTLPRNVIQAELPVLIQNLPKPFILTADTNAHHTTWGSPLSDSKGEAINQILQESELTILNTSEPTYLASSGQYSHIDLTIITPDIAPLFNWTPSPDPYNSDHFPLIIATHVPLEASEPQRWHIKAADWAGFQQSLILPTAFLSPTQACGAVTTAILAAAQAHIPCSTPGRHRPGNCWWTKECAIA